MPFVRVHQLINNVQQQVNEQLESNEKLPADEGDADKKVSQ